MQRALAGAQKAQQAQQLKGVGILGGGGLGFAQLAGLSYPYQTHPDATTTYTVNYATNAAPATYYTASNVLANS